MKKNTTPGKTNAGCNAGGKVFVRSEHAVSRMIDGEAVIVEPKKGLVNVVTTVGSSIWQLLDGTRTAGDIAGIIAAEYDVLPATAMEDTIAFLENLADKELVRNL